MWQRPVSAVLAFILVVLTGAVAQGQTKKVTKAKPAVAVEAPTVEIAPVNPNASPEARALLQYLYSISGKATLTGQHNYPNHISRWTDRAFNLTGKYPALYGQDFGFSAGEDKDSVEARPALIEEAKRQYQNGAVVTLTWHELRPMDDEPTTFMGSVRKTLTDFEWNELLTPGTDLNKRWCAQADVVAGYLKHLRDAHVPVLFRPYHEMNGNWFWWGYRPGPKGSAALYRQIYDRFVNHHKLNNLVWLWNVNAPSTNAGPFADYYPGADYVDVLTVDNYGEFKQQYYDDMLALAKGKPVALGEVGTIPDVEVFKAQPRWTYFMTWSEWIEEANALEKVKQVYAMPTMLGREDQRLSTAMAEIRKASSTDAVEPVTPEASSSAKELLAKLRSASGKAMLTGQENEAGAPTAATEHVVAVTAKAPAIYGAELGAAPQAIVEEAKRQHQNGAVVSLSWRPARPTDEETAAWEKSVRGQLTDFEWSQLLTPGTKLNERWAAQVDAVAGYLKQLDKAGVAVIWRPYPETNGKDYWWAGRKGADGSAALYRQLFDRLINKDGVRNLIWVWDAAPASQSEYHEFFPGLLYVDALAVRANDVTWNLERPLKVIATGKIIGLEVNTRVPDASVLGQGSWSWLMLGAGQTSDPARDEALRKLYTSPQMSARTVSGTANTGSTAK